MASPRMILNGYVSRNKARMPSVGHYFLCIILLFSAITHAKSSKIRPKLVYQSSILAIPDPIQSRMRHTTWHPGCPIAIQDLAYIELSYWGFDAQAHTGALIINKELATEIVAIFKTLFEHRFPIQRMEPIENFQGNDHLSMAANNTSAFNCRTIIGSSNEYSQHSYGRAIDINPLLNPYIHNNHVHPPQGAIYADRQKILPGKIIKGDIVYRSFIEYGWDWGGNWYNAQDYQHFEKRAHGKRRNPYGHPNYQK